MIPDNNGNFHMTGPFGLSGTPIQIMSGLSGYIGQLTLVKQINQLQGKPPIPVLGSPPNQRCIGNFARCRLIQCGKLVRPPDFPIKTGGLTVRTVANDVGDRRHTQSPLIGCFKDQTSRNNLSFPRVWRVNRAMSLAGNHQGEKKNRDWK